MTQDIDKDLDEARAVLAKMTPGEWHGPSLAEGVRHLERNCDWYGDDLPEGMSLPGRQDGDGGTRDGNGIAYLKNHAEGWLDELARLREALRWALDHVGIYRLHAGENHAEGVERFNAELAKARAALAPRPTTGGETDADE